MSTVNIAAIEELIVYPATSLKKKTSLGK